MIIYLKNHEIDREQWDCCIKNSSCSKPYPYSWFLDRMSPGWEALIDDDYDSVFPIPVRSRLSIRYIVTPPFVQHLGAFSPDKPVNTAIYEFLQYLPDFYRYVDICIDQNLSLNGMKVTEKFNYTLDLSGSYDKLYEGFASECKRKIYTAERKGIELTKDIKPSEIIDLFILNNGRIIKGIKPVDYQRLKNLMEFCLKNKKGRILGVRNARKKLIYGIFIVEIPGSKTILFDAHTSGSRERRVGYFTINNLIKEYSSSRTILDFAGLLMTETVPFVESFGATKAPYYNIRKSSLFWLPGILR